MDHSQLLPSLPYFQRNQKERQKKKLKDKRAKCVIARLVERRMWGKASRQILWAVKDMPLGNAVQVS